MKSLRIAIEKRSKLCNVTWIRRYANDLPEFLVLITDLHTDQLITPKDQGLGSRCVSCSVSCRLRRRAVGECICTRSVGLPCGLPTKPPTGHGGPRPEPFRMTSCLVRVSYVPTRTKLLVSEARGVLTLQHHLHNGLCRNMSNCGGERSPGLGEAPTSEEGVMNIIFLRAVSTPRRPAFSHPIEVLPKVTVPRQELTQVEIYLPVATIYPGLKFSNETEGPATVRSFRPPPLLNLQSLHPGSSQGIFSTPLGSLLEDGLSLDGQQINRNHPSHDRHGRAGNGAIGAGDPECRSSL
ncbi:hypothetical protein J6590_085996 [Homalodisca vitripennis]|nr:hypothetical protein J6590_085996 [Homalodisca vitripennis]